MYTFVEILNAIQEGSVNDSMENQMRKEIAEAEQKRIIEMFKTK